MKLQPVIQAKLNNYKQLHGLSDIKDGDAFEIYANETILTTHQPSAFNVENDLLDTISVGGSNDMGIDGIAIKLNGVLISNIDDAMDLVSRQESAEIEYIFLQSKYKEKFDTKEFNTFVTGVKDFLDCTNLQPHNDKVEHWLKVKDYLESEDVLQYWPEPTIRLYYIAMGTWNSDSQPHIMALEKRFRLDIKQINTFKEIYFNYIDLNSFKVICEENENFFTTVLDVIDTSSLPEVNKVNNSCVSVCPAESLIKMLTSSEGLLRRNLFSDNVRDYQGDTTINKEILETIKNDPQSFVLLNNGITIVCDDVNFPNRKISLKNPQIVNGCQTCNVLYYAYKAGISLTDIFISVKVIATRDSDIINDIVKGTNRQNIVYDEAFEVTKPFHKDLESFFKSLPLDNSIEKIYYERRSKQYWNTPNILVRQKVNFKILIQSFVSVFLCEPHEGHRHESKLLLDYQNKIFVENQSRYPYYTAALIFQKVELSYRRNLIPKHLRPYKAQISLLLKEIMLPNCPDINDEKAIGEYCEKLLQKLWDEPTFMNSLETALKTFDEITSRWVKERGEKYISGIKDSIEFTKFLVNNISTGTSNQSVDNIKLRGYVADVKCGRAGKYYGFITRSPRDAFFHQNDNDIKDYEALKGREVLYTLKRDNFGRERAINIQLVHANDIAD